MKISKSQYKLIDDMMADVFLMFKNAKQYNEPNSLVYQDAVLLENLARQKVSELCQKVQGREKNEKKFSKKFKKKF